MSAFWTTLLPVENTRFIQNYRRRSWLAWYLQFLLESATNRKEQDMISCPQTYSPSNDPWTVLSSGPWVNPNSPTAGSSGNCLEQHLPNDRELALQVWAFVDAEGDDQIYLKLSWVRADGRKWSDLQVGLFEPLGEIRDLVLAGEQAIGLQRDDNGEHSYAYQYDVTTTYGHFRLLVRVYWQRTNDSQPEARFEACLAPVPEW